MFRILILIVTAGSFSLTTTYGQSPTVLHTLNINSSRDLKNFFRYSQDRIPFVSAHRGGPGAGYPENCIATFQNTLSKTWAILEIDAHYTKDSGLVLMHDPTLNRTSEGKGKVSDYTLEELKKMRLKDTEGKLTGYTIPTLDEALEWAKGKTILVLDQKDVPMAVRVKKIIEHQAQNSAMVIAYSIEDAKLCYEMDKNIMMEVMAPDGAALAKLDSSGVPWMNLVAFVTHIKPKQPDIFELIHRRGAMCIVGSSRTIDKAYINKTDTSLANLATGYRKIISDGADIIEADLGIEAGSVLTDMKQTRSDKSVFFILSKK